MCMQVHVTVALGGMLQGARSLEAAMELIEFTHTCASLALRGIATEHADPEARAFPPPCACQHPTGGLACRLC
jgi:hypothetical protein